MAMLNNQRVVEKTIIYNWRILKIVFHRHVAMFHCRRVFSHVFRHINPKIWRN